MEILFSHKCFPKKIKDISLSTQHSNKHSMVVQHLHFRFISAEIHPSTICLLEKWCHSCIYRIFLFKQLPYLAELQIIQRIMTVKNYTRWFSVAFSNVLHKVTSISSRVTQKMKINLWTFRNKLLSQEARSFDNDSVMTEINYNKNNIGIFLITTLSKVNLRVEFKVCICWQIVKQGATKTVCLLKFLSRNRGDLIYLLNAVFIFLIKRTG